MGAASRWLGPGEGWVEHLLWPFRLVILILAVAALFAADYHSGVQGFAGSFISSYLTNLWATVTVIGHWLQGLVT